MALPTCNVVCAMHDQEGAPVPGATFEFRLNRQEVYEGFVVPTRVLATAGEDGTCTVALWPNQLGSAESSYQVTIRSPGGKSERVLATIPNVATVNLHDVSALPPYPGKPDAQAYLETAQGIVADAQEAASNSSNSAAASQASANSALASANAASAERDAAQAARSGAEAAADAAAAAAGTAAAAAGAAASSATAAANSLTDINTGLAGKLAIAGGAMTGNLTIPSLNGGQMAGHRRRNLNGDCRFAQLGASYPAATSHTIDMWGFYRSGAQVSTVTQEADAPAGSGLQYSHRSTVTTADAAIAAGDFALHRSVIEGFDVADFVGRTFTVSFRVRSAKTGIHCVALRNSGSDRSYVHEITIAAANTWETHKFTVVGGLPSGGTWNLTSGAGLDVSFVLAAGSTYHTTADAWQTGNFLATANQVNVVDTVGNVFAVTGLQVEPGDTATPYERRGFGRELQSMTRYGRLNGTLAGWSVSTVAINGLAVDFSDCPMRATPTVLLVAGVGAIHDASVAFRDFSAPFFAGSTRGGYVSGTCTTTTANKQQNLMPGSIFFDARL